MEKAKCLLLFVAALVSTTTSVCVPRTDTSLGYNASLPSKTIATPFRSSAPHVATSKLLHAVKAVCNRTEYPKSCIAAVTPLIRFGSRKPGVGDVLRFLVKAGKQKTHHNLRIFSKAASDPATEKMVAMILGSCVDKYSLALDDYDKAMNAVASKDKFSARDSFSAALTDYDTCANGDAPGDPTLDRHSKWAAKNKALVEIASNCLSLVMHLHLNQP